MAADRVEGFPGWGLPLTYMPEGDVGLKHARYQRARTKESGDKSNRSLIRFKNAIQDWRGRAIPLREIAMMGLMRELMEKPEWERKVCDEVIVEKWKAEALENFEFTVGMWDYCLAELRDKAEVFKKQGIVSALDFDCKVVYTDCALSQEVAQALSAAVAPLENVPEKDKDWHPGSDNQVLDLVHPSLFPLIYGRSRVLPWGKVGLQDCASWTGKGDIIPLPEEEEPTGNMWSSGHTYVNADVWSGRFQWLPCDVVFTGEQDVRIASYINNLHPSHKDLYRVIETAIAKSIPLWDEVLWSTERAMHPSRIDIEGYKYTFPQGTKAPRPANAEPSNNSDLDSDSDSDLEYAEQDDDWREATRVLQPPDPAQYVRQTPPGPEELIDLRTRFAEQGLQVIVKLATIHLTPAKPTYAGGSWHVEGQLNEHIVASSLYYYAQSNIGASTLAFRQSVETEVDPCSYGQDDYHHILDALGVRNRGPAYSDLGSVKTKQGRLLAFPNVLQHRVPAFDLEDAAQPGYRKILALFLVDPHVRVLSTAKVPPQQKEWWAREIFGADGSGHWIGELPVELRTQIVDDVEDFPVGLDEAKELRDEVIVERSRIGERVVGQADRNRFNLCEH